MSYSRKIYYPGIILFRICPYFRIFAINFVSRFQKQPSRDVLRKRCSKNIQQIYRKPTRNAKQLYWNLLIEDILYNGHLSTTDTFTVSLSFLQSLLFYFFSSLMAFPLPWKRRDRKFVGISSPYSSLWLTCFPVAKMPKAQWDSDRNMDTIMEISVALGQPLLLYSEN